MESLAVRAKGIPELARELRVHRVTVRYHVSFLMSQGLVEVVETEGAHKVGRPATLYRMTRRALVHGYVERHFDFLGRIAIEAFVGAVGSKTASTVLRAKGVEVGRSMVHDLRAKVGVAAWTPDTFERFVLGGLFREFGVSTEVLSRSPNVLVYRSSTCPFLELAEQMPDMVCNALDRGFHRGVDAALGGARTERLACMGHGDPYCEYRVTWQGGTTSAPSQRPGRKRGFTGRKGVRG